MSPERGESATGRELEQCLAPGERDVMSSAGAGGAGRGGVGAAMFDRWLLLAERQPAAARVWLEQAAAAGNPDANFELGKLLVNTAPRVARRCWEQAAAAGHHEALVSLLRH
jgi:TPR repeat protein